MFPGSPRTFQKWSLDNLSRNFLYFGGATYSLWTFVSRLMVDTAY